MGVPLKGMPQTPAIPGGGNSVDSNLNVQSFGSSPPCHALQCTFAMVPTNTTCSFRFVHSPLFHTKGAVAFTSSAGKPRRGALRRVLAELAIPPAHVAIVGDRVFTDVLAGNRLGLYTVLVKPVNPEGQPCPHDRWQMLEVKLARLAGASLR